MHRINKLRESLSGNEAVYITAYPDIFYYSGFQSPDAALLISHDMCVLITDSRYLVQAKIQSPDFEIYDIKNGLKDLFHRIGSVIGYQEEHISAGKLEKLKEEFAEKTFAPMSDLITKPRRVKDSFEIEKLKNAEELGDRAFSYILGIIKPGMSERDIALEIEFFMRKNGASGVSFETIVASGARSCMPHGVASDKVIEKGDLVTLDFGCVLDGYCSDMTRTIGVGKLCDKAVHIYNTVKEAQQIALDAIKPGVRLCDVDKAARDYITEAGFGDNFGHALGHSVGIEIHENPCFSPKSCDIIEEGNVLSVEPGIYIEGFGGVRIEDLVAFYNEKTDILSKSSKDLILI